VTELRKTVCNRDCPDACAIVATVEEERVLRIQGDPDHPITRGFLCHRTSHFLETQYAPDRLTTPLLRKDGELQPVGWDEALDFAASRLNAIRAESGPAAIFHYRSGGSLGLLKHLCDWFFERFGPVTTKRGDICSGAGDAAQMLDFGVEDSNDVFDLENSRSILIWGKNVVTSSPHLIPILKRARARGARLVLVDPVHHRTAELCDAYHQPRPGGDFALAMATLAILAERGWMSPIARAYCDNVDELLALAGSRTVADLCAEADVSPEVAEDLARMLGPGKPCAILVGWGMGRRVSGAATVRALDALGAMSGNLHLPGGGVSFYFKRRAAFDVSFIRGAEAAPRTVCEPLFGQEIERATDPPIRAVWVTAGNPVAMLPDSAVNARALASRELLVVVDSFLTDTARLAHLVLPTTTLLEADDLVGAYGHHFIGSATPVVAPPPGVRSDLEIMQGLAARVGLAEAMAGTAREWKRRILHPDVSLDQLDAGPLPSPVARKVLFADLDFPTPTGRANLIHTWPAPPEPAPPGYPLWLMSLSTDKAQSSQWARTPVGPAVVTVHPDAASGIPDGGLGRLESSAGSLEVRVAHDPSQRRDVAIIPKGGHLRDGRCANALVRARTTDLGEGGALYDERVRLVPIC
jgi:anaerobic selenocysteine-containing dehydrogenase